MRHRFVLVFTLALAALGSPLALAAQNWADVTAAAEPLHFDGRLGRTSGEVAEGFAAFVFDAPSPGRFTAEVDVTEVREGLEYEDDDSVLFLFDADGYLLEENDDGPFGYASLIDGAEISEPGTYYLVVTTHPRFVFTDESGRFVGFDEPGLSSIAFDLILEAGTRGAGRGYSLEDVFAMAVPFEFDGERVAVGASVDGDIAVFEVYLRGPTNATVEVVITEEHNGRDSVLTITDANGYVIGEDDDGGVDGASRIVDVPLTESEVYYMIVSSWPDGPRYASDGRLDGFAGDGDSAFDFTLEITGTDGASVAETPDDEEPFDADESATSFDEVVSTATPIRWEGSVGAASGRVFAGYESFEIEVDTPMDVTIEVLTIAPEDEPPYMHDSMLMVFDAHGLLIASDDDGGEDGAAKIANLRLSEPGSFYAVVTTFPNDGAIDDDGYFEAIYPDGGSDVEFTLELTGEFDDR
jgi:hypothetical protein